MANVVINGIEHALEDVAHWITGVKTVVLKGPAIITNLGVLLAAVDKVIADVELDVANPTVLINIPVTQQQLADLKTVWTDIKTVFVSAGVKI